jgi:hypothetical protein
LGLVVDVSFKVPEDSRITLLKIPPGLPNDAARKLITTPHCGLWGAFYLNGPCGTPLFCIGSDGSDWVQAGLPGQPWEHVSVSLAQRPPNWQEMCFVKDKFWGEEDAVIQIHPPKSEYVNFHPFVLHLWRPTFIELPRPPSITVGPKGFKENH